MTTTSPIRRIHEEPLPFVTIPDSIPVNPDEWRPKHPEPIPVEPEQEPVKVRVR